MKQNKQSKGGSRPEIPTRSNTLLFGKENYKLMLIGLVVLAIGFVLMPGGKSANTDVFDASAIYSFTRITLSPILIVGGLAIEVYAIMKKSKDKNRA